MDRDFPDFVSQRDGNVWRVMVCNGRDGPFPLRIRDHYPSDSSMHKAAAAIVFSAEVRCPMTDDRGMSWGFRGDAEQAVTLARKAVGR